MKPDLLTNPIPLLKGASHFNVPIERIQSDRSQPRQVFPEEELADLAESIRQRGMLHPIAVRHAAANNRFTIITGERRYRAARKAALSSVPCLVITGELTEVQILGLQLTENLQREDLKPVEEAEAFHKLMTLQGWNRMQLGKFLGISPAGITKRFGLLTLTGAIKAEVEAGNLSSSSAYLISQLPKPAEQENLARQVVQENLSRDAVAAKVRQSLRQPAQTKRATETNKSGEPKPKTSNHSPAPGNKGNPPAAGQANSPQMPLAPEPNRQQKLFNIGAKSIVTVQTSAPKLSASDVFATLQEAILEASQNLRVPEQDDSSTMQIVQELLTCLRSEEQALGSELQDLMNLLALMITNKLGDLLKNKLAAGAAAQRALNRLSEATQRTVGVLLEEQTNKTK